MTVENETSPVVSPCKVFCLTKNEHDLIEDYIQFYGTLFGYENVVVIDNGSDHPGVFAVYDKYLPRGVKIHVDPRAYSQQAVMMTEHMLFYKPTCEFMLPLDTDEFIFMANGQDLTRDNVLKALRSVPAFIGGMFYGKILDSVVDASHPSYVDHAHLRPARNMTKFRQVGNQKIIVRASSFDYVVTGNHEAHTSMPFRHILHGLGLLHLTNTGQRRRFERSIKMIADFEPLTSLAKDVTSIVGLCQHAQTSGMVGGHQFAYLILFAMRHLAVHVWRIRQNRLPTMEEIEFVDSMHADPRFHEKIIAHCAGAGAGNLTATKTPLATLDDVVFAIPTPDAYDVEVRQVADFLASV